MPINLRVKTKLDVSKLNKKNKDLKSVTVIAGYSLAKAPYALFVHENTEMKWKGLPRISGLGSYWDARSGQGTSKFLEKPARQMASSGSRKAASVYRNTQSVRKMMLAVAQELKDASLKIVPYEYGTLYKSFFIFLRGRNIKGQFTKVQ